MGDLETGTLKAGEPHPMAYMALDFVKKHHLPELMAIQEALASCALEGGRIAEVCGETLRRVIAGEPVSDRYLLGLAWYLKEHKDRAGS